MVTKLSYTSAGTYIDSFTGDTKVLLKKLRETIRKAAPEAEEVISYNMPAYKFHGMLAYFAGHKNHIGFYPGASGIEAFKDELSEYKWAKGSVQFPINKPLPLDLITRIIIFRVIENLKKAELKAGKKKEYRNRI
jgi:uncharacterized protein YdhG (YjbR/CyaY superfamily)